MLDLPSIEELRSRGSLKWTGVINPRTDEAADGAWVAEMDFGTPPEVAKTLKTMIDNGVLGYMPPRLPVAARAAVRDYYEYRTGLHIPEGSCGLLPDVLTGLRGILQYLAQPGVPVVVPTPAYMPFLTIPKEMGHPLIQVPSFRGEDGKWQIDFEALEQAASDGCVMIMCNPWNPTGRSLSAAELQRFAEIAEKNNAWIFNDEIHFPLTMPDRNHLSLLEAAPEVIGRTVTATAASKGWNVAGLKCAFWIIIDPDLRQRWVEATDYAHLATPPGVAAAAAAFGDSRQWLDEARAYIWENFLAVRQVVRELAPQITIPEIEATYLTLWDCSALELGDRCAAEICLEDANVAVNSGRTLGEDCENLIRFNIAGPREVVVDMARRCATALAQAAKVASEK